jgi:hypothetical protein
MLDWGTSTCLDRRPEAAEMTCHSAKSLLFVGLVGALATGCAAARSNYYLYDATDVILKAKAAGASEAVYEWTMATEFLLKAREEAGYSDYEYAETLARESIDWARRAQEAVEVGITGREKDIEQMVEDAVEDVPEDFEDAAVPDNSSDNGIRIDEYEDMDDVIDFLEEDE